jgi:hypothetical protein
MFGPEPCKERLLTRTSTSLGDSYFRFVAEKVVYVHSRGRSHLPSCRQSALVPPPDTDRSSKVSSPKVLLNVLAPLYHGEIRRPCVVDHLWNLNVVHLFSCRHWIFAREFVARAKCDKKYILVVDLKLGCAR